MIKKLILITGILLSTSLWASPMDNICYLGDTQYELTNFLKNRIKSECERNNIFQVDNMSVYGVRDTITAYCRYDREITTFERPIPDIPGEKYYDLSCVLYSNEGRKIENVVNLKD